MNLSIKALFCWVKAATGSGEETHIEDLQNGEILLKLVHLLKKSIPSSCHCVDERFKIISNFIKSDCRFNALNGTPIEWEAIKDGRNLSVEIAKVILILVYYDMMNDHCTLKKLDCDVERQIAGLTLTYVEENEGSVSLVPGLDAHLSRRHLTVSHNILEKSATVSTTTSVSSLSSLYDDDESPLFGRSQKVKFLDLQKVASSSVSSSPIQDVMNTPVFQMRRMKRQLMQDRDYIDGLEKELSNKLALLSQRESLINQLQYCLDKLKEDRGVDEQSTRARIDELENKKNMLQSCLDDFLKQNKELKNNAAMSDRKVNELAEENGVLTSQMRTVCSRLAISEAEVGKLTEAHESNEAEWQSSISTLQSELCEARAQKELYAEQIEILQGKISCLKDEIDRSTQEEGENMWISVEKQLLESRICTLTEELENATNSLEKIEAEVQAKTQQLKACEREISDQKELLIQKQNQIDQLLESKNEAIDKLQKEMAEMGETLQQEIQALKLRLEEAEKQKQEQATRFQVQVVSCNEEIEKLKEIKYQKEELLLQTVERADDLMTKLCSANTLLSGRDQEVSGLKEKVHLLTETHQQTKKESQALFSQLQEKSQEAEALKGVIDSLKDEVNILKSSLERAEEEMQIKTTLLSETKQENDEQMEALQRDIVLCKETIETLKMEIRMKDEQIIEAKRNNLMQCEKQQQEICALKAQIGILGESLNEAKQQAQNCQTEAKKQKEESCQNESLLQEQLSSSEEMVKHLKEEMNTKTAQLAMLENQSADQSANVTDLQQQVASLRAQLVKAEEDVQIKENHFALKQDQVEGLLAQVSQFEDEIKRMQGNLQRKEVELFNLKKETLKHEEQLKEDYLKRSEELDYEISRLTLQVKSLHESLNSTAEQLTVKEDLLARKETELSQETDAAQKLKATVDELIVLRQQLQAKEREMITLKDESDEQSNLQQEEIQIMKSQLEDMAKTLRCSEEGKLQIISEQLKSAQEQELLQEQLSQCQIVVKQLENEVGAKEREMALNSEQSKALCLQNEDLQKRLESLASSLEDAQEKMHSKELLLIQHQQEAKQKQENLMLKVEQAEKETLELKVKSSQSQVDLLQKEELLLQMQEQHQIIQAELSAFKIKMTENDNYVVKLEEEAVAQIEVIRQTKELKCKNSAFIELQEQSSRQIGDLQQCVESLKSLLEDRSQNAAAKDEQFRGLQLESVQKIEDLKQELVSVAAELNQQKEMNIHILRQKDETIESTQMERDSLIKQKAALDARVLAVEQQLEGAVLENKRLSQAKQAFERENYAALKLQAKLQEELQVLKRDNSILLNEKEKVKDVEEEDLLQQLTAKTTAMEHYKAQMEKAMDHYNSKKELLKKSEGEVANLKHALEVQGSELKNVTLEKKLMQMELERIQSNEKKLLNKIASLEAQQSFADKALCEQNTLLNDHKAQGRRASTLEVAGDRFGIKRSKPQSISSDSLDQSSLDDSLNDTRKLSAPESSTPLVRSSERLAAKRHVLQAESLETLYFTPINTRHRSNTGTKPEASAKRNSASSVKRRRTTQVINITMTKKTPGRNEADETFYSLASARSQPNLSSAHKVSTELFNTPKAAESDQLIGLPGYRRSTIHSQATSTFCVGAENEPDGGPEDWMRIAEIQARNKACLPHLKSSYPLEFDSVRNSALIFTDEELRTGDPIETIRRASVMPGQLQDSLTSHRLSYMGQSANMAPSLSRLSTMPGQVNSTLRSPKGSKRAASTLSLHTTSPEKKTRASCFPRPLTPKNRNVSGPAFPHCQTAPSPADRRQSMMFTIDNTPKKDARKDLLKKGLNKLRNSTRKSPGKSLKSPAQSASRRGQENVPTKAGRPAVGGAGRLGSQKSPQVPNKGQRKSPRGPQRAAKSPGITASARKMMSRMKV